MVGATRPIGRGFASLALHRYALFLCAATFVLVFAACALGTVIVQGLLGGMTVLLKLPTAGPRGSSPQRSSLSRWSRSGAPALSQAFPLRRAAWTAAAKVIAVKISVTARESPMGATPSISLGWPR